MNDVPDENQNFRDRTLEQRVLRLEEAFVRVDQRLITIETEIKHLPSAADYAALRADIARIDGKLSNMPTTWQLFVALVTTIVTTWSAGAAIVFALLRFAPK
jgi:hypothetical protein